MALAGCALPHADLARRGDGQFGDGDAAPPGDTLVIEGGADANPEDVPLDAAQDDGAPDVSPVDAIAPDGAAPDVADAVASDVGLDAQDASAEGGLDASSDASDASRFDAGEAGTDAALDARPDTTPDAGTPFEAGADAIALDGSSPARDASADVGMDAPADAGALRYRLGAPGTLAWSPDGPPPLSTVFERRCGENQLVVGANVDVSSSVNVMNGYALVCAPLNANGTLGATLTTLARVGGTDNNQTPRCGAGTVGLIRSVSAGAVIDEVRIDCAQLAPLLPPSPREVIASTIRMTNEGGGTERPIRCPLGSVLVGMDSTLENFSFGSRIGRVRPVCAPIELY